MWATIEIIWDGSKLLINDNGGYEKRNQSTIKLFKSAFEIYLQNKKDPFRLKISTADRNKSGFYCYSNSQNKNIIPDFTFDNWEVVHIFNYDKKVDEMIEASTREIISNKVFWIGNCNTHPLRKSLVNDNVKNDKTLFIDSGNWKKSEKTSIDGSYMTSGPYMSLQDHANYKYLLDIRGAGFSARFKLLLFLNRPVFYVDRDENEYFFYDLKPYVHYIPVKSDLSDLNEKILWAESHEEECKSIAKNAQEYAINNLRTKNAIDYFAKVLLSLSEKK